MPVRMVICAPRGVWVERSMKLCNKHKVLATIVLRNFSSERKNGSTNHRKVPTKKYFFSLVSRRVFFSSGICSEMFRNVPGKKRKKIVFVFLPPKIHRDFLKFVPKIFRNVPKMFQKCSEKCFPSILFSEDRISRLERRVTDIDSPSTNKRMVFNLICMLQWMKRRTIWSVQCKINAKCKLNKLVGELLIGNKVAE